MTSDAGPTVSAPFRSGPFPIRADWIDSNGHLNLAYYVLIFDQATDALWDDIGLGATLRGSFYATFAAETHTLYRAELLAHDTAVVQSQLLACDDKRLHISHEMMRLSDGVVSAQQELMYLCVSFDTRRVAPWPTDTERALHAAVRAHADLPCPSWIGRRIAMRSPAAPAPTASTAPGPG